MGEIFLAQVRKPARARAGANGYENYTRYVPASLDEILSLPQCASWLQQPERVLRDMIGSGVLKPPPFPGADPRLHARSVLLQLGIAGNALDSRPTATNTSSPGREHDRNAKPGKGLLCRHAPESQSDAGFTEEAEIQRQQLADMTSASSKRLGESRPARIPEPKETIVRRSYESHGRKIEATYRLGNSPRHKLAEANLLDIVVGSLKPGRN